MMNTLKIYLFRTLGKQNRQIYPCRLADFGIFSYAFGLGALLCFFFFAVGPRCRGQSLRTEDSDASPWLGKSALEPVGPCRDACPSTWPWPWRGPVPISLSDSASESESDDDSDSDSELLSPTGRGLW